MILRKIDYITSVIASLSFVGSVLVVFLFLVFGLSAILSWADEADAGLVIGLLAFIASLPSGWLGSYLALRYFAKRTKQTDDRMVFGYFAPLAIVALIICANVTSAIGMISVSIPLVIVSLAGTYLVAKIMALRKLRRTTILLALILSIMLYCVAMVGFSFL